MNWYPPPRSGKPGRVAAAAQPDPRPGGHSDSADGPCSRTLRAGRRRKLLLVDAASRLAGPLWLPLTGGVDSRTLLAVAAAAGLDVTTYTFVGD